MSVQINYLKKSSSEFSANLILFADEKLNTKNFKRHLTDTEFTYISDLLKTSDSKRSLFVFEVNSKKKNCCNQNKK